MISVSYYLHSFISTEGKSSIYVRVHADGLYQLRAAIHEKIKPKNWNHPKQQVKAAEDHYKEINDRMEGITARIQKDFRTKLDRGEPVTKDDLQAIIRPVAKGKVKERIATVRDVYNDWKANYLEEKNAGNPGREKGTNYVRRFLQVLTKLEEFKPGATLADIDKAFLKKYRSFLLAAGLQDVTVQNHYKCIKVLLNYKNLPAAFVKPPQSAKPTKHSLYWSEVIQLATADYNTKRVKEIALCFVVNCQLCLRYSDLHKVNTNLITVESIKHGTVEAVNLTQEKTGDQVYIPVPPRAAAILAKYGGVLPLPKLDKNSSSYAFNQWLKQAAKEAGLNRVVRTTKVINGNIIEKWRPLHEQISAHSSRHTGYSRIREATQNKDLAEALLGHANAGPYDHADPVTVVDALLDGWKALDPTL